MGFVSQGTSSLIGVVSSYSGLGFRAYVPFFVTLGTAIARVYLP